MTIAETKHNENNLVECFEIEKMVVPLLEKCLKELEKDYCEVMREGDEKTQELKNERYQLKIKECHC